MSSWSDNNAIFISLPTDQLLTITAYGEAGNQGADGMMGVINTVRNRTLDRSFYDEEIYSLTSDPYKAVILKKYQFSMYLLNDPVRAKVEAIAKNFDARVSSSQSLQQAYNIAQMAVEGTLEDNTGGAQFYFNPAGVSNEPQWAGVIPFLGQIGDHLFFGSGVSAAIASAVSTIEETAGEAVTVMRSNSNITTLILAGLGIGAVLVMTRKSK
jgi:hypothetical protein